MSRLACLRALSAATLLALALPAAAAEATRVASSGDEDNPFDLDFTMKFDFVQTRALISREYTYDYSGTAPTPLESVEERPELRYTRRSTALLPRLAIGLYRDLEFHVEVPIILSSSSSWTYARIGGVSQRDISATDKNDIDANGDACATPPCPVFDASSAVFHDIGFGDVKLGLAWGILSDARDDTKPFWLVGLDFTFPTSEMYDPGFGRVDPTNPTNFKKSPYSDDANAGPSGENVLKIDLVTALSKRMGPVDPYVSFHVTSYRPSAKTYSNCDHAQEFADAGQMLLSAPATCGSDASKGEYGPRPPWVTGAAFGVEVVTGENKADGTRVALDFRIKADYVSSSRWFNELTDATGKLLLTEDYFNVEAFFGFYWRASKYMQLQATAHLGTETPHFITGEDTDGLDAAGKAKNPNFDYRYDAAGRRYRLTEVSDFGVALSGVLQF